MPPREVIALFGPTGVGKTAVALALARRLRARGEEPVAVSADALQVYAGLETLTGAATAAERAELEHRLLSFVPLTESFSAGRYARLAHAEIDALLAAGRRPIVVGGTGLYLRAALTELSLQPPPAPGVRERWMAELRRVGPAALHAELAHRAPWAAAPLAPTDGRRIVRALELLDSGALRSPDRAASRAGPATGHGHAAERADVGRSASDARESELWTADTRHPTLLVGLVMEREPLYAQIDARVEAMVAGGAVDEVRRAAAAGASTTARAALGFEDLLAGDVAAMQRRTRRYARRQLTWMRKLAGVVAIDVTGREPDAVAAEIEFWLELDAL
ncbi:MAG TPA: isopentenyl transferase family protein [Solirubrobacteraceae bacterium]|nr:isopentenyl transferase family protein [Solirubrobacteraceae bacterium]